MSPENGKKQMTKEQLDILMKSTGMSEEEIKGHTKTVVQLPSKLPLDVCLDKFITKNNCMLSLKDEVRKIAHEQDCVLIQGETGTGKELLARALHGNRDAKFIGINCAGMPENLLEGELFGYVPGAFTGSNPKGYMGLVKAAAKGTLFLDEIGEMPLHLQSKLLKVIQDRETRKVGDDKVEHVSCRFVAASNRKLTENEPGIFRPDLFYRLSTFELTTLPLERRPEDIRPILQHLDTEHKLPEEFYARIKSSNLKGNVRSLEQLVRRFYVLGKLPPV